MIEENLESFDEIVARLRKTYTEKNIDYGDSFKESLDEDGLIAFKVRAGDKWLRIKQLLKSGKSEVKSESIKDTIEDLANYCIMAAMWLEGSEGKGKKKDNYYTPGGM